MSEQEAIDYNNLTDECVALKVKVNRLRDFVQELADMGCWYADNCPQFSGLKHGTCIACAAKQALETGGEK